MCHWGDEIFLKHLAFYDLNDAVVCWKSPSWICLLPTFFTTHFFHSAFPLFISTEQSVFEFFKSQIYPCSFLSFCDIENVDFLFPLSFWALRNADLFPVFFSFPVFSSLSTTWTRSGYRVRRMDLEFRPSLSEKMNATSSKRFPPTSEE